MRSHAPAAAAAILALSGCGSVKVTRLGAEASPRPDDCAVEFLQKAPDRPFDEIAELDTHVTNVPRQGPLEVLRQPSCRMGADAVVVTRNFVINMLGHVQVAGTAIRYRPEPPPAPPAEPAPPPAAAPPAPAGTPPAAPADQPPRSPGSPPPPPAAQTPPAGGTPPAGSSGSSQ